MVLNCIIADDDKTSQAVLNPFFMKYDRLNHVAAAGNGKQALNLAKNMIRILFFWMFQCPS
jgi:DNA-binding LytR/AlgR family response regulator